MARLGKRERMLKRAIIHANLSSPKPEAATMAVRSRDGTLRVIRGDTLGRDSVQRLAASIGTARGPQWRDRMDPKEDPNRVWTGPLYGTPQAKEEHNHVAEMTARYDHPDIRARQKAQRDREIEKRWGCKAE